ncbi:MAG: aldehyde ferredoxin oxidoreductase N-terminal domain-containing protein [Desulfobacterales bacterium]
MTTNTYGWCGKILKIDLSELRISELDTMDYAERFLGGRGIATRIYWEEVGPDVGAFDPENRLILMTGPLGATGVQGASRFEVVGKSPMLMPEGFCYGNLGGFFAPYLKRAGYDGIVVFGRSEKPVYIWIHDGKAEILDASSIWGKGVYSVREILKETHGKNVRFVCTGVAGENMCRSANLMTDNEGSATGGFGAVIGSKNLKAIAVLGTGNPLVANPEKLKELNKLSIHLNKRDPLQVPYPEEQVRRTGKSSCYQCGLDCKYRSSFRTASGKDVVRKCQSMFVYLPWVFRRPGESTETAVDATGICNDLSICTMEMSNIIHWLETCYQAGYLTDKETGLNISKLGTHEFFKDLANMIAHRQGFGEILAQGLLRAGEKLGREAKSHFANEVSGVGDGATYSAREYLMNGLLYALEPRQPIAMLHEISWLTGLWAMNQAHPGSSPVTSEVFRAAATRFWGHEKAWDLMTHEGKARAAVNIMDRTYVKDSLLLCDSSWPIMVSWNTQDHVGDPSLESRIFSAVTGIETDEAGLNQYGERIFNLQRGVLLREGRRPKTDDVPAGFNFTDPVETVFMNPDVIVPGLGEEVISRKGKTLDRSVFEEMRREFYELRGWDPESGMQKAETLERLGMSDLLKDLKRMGLIETKIN